MSDALIQQFIGVTGADTHSARTYLEMANNDLPNAINLFFDSGPVPSPNPPMVTPSQAPVQPAGQPSRAVPQRGSGGWPQGADQPRPKRRSRTGGIFDSQEEGEEGEGNTYDAGGYASRVQVQAPPKDEGALGIPGAREATAEDSDSDEEGPGAGHAVARTARREADWSGAARSVSGRAPAAGRPRERERAAGAPKAVKAKRLTVRITMYSNGLLCKVGSEERFFAGEEGQAIYADLKQNTFPDAIRELVSAEQTAAHSDKPVKFKIAQTQEEYVVPTTIEPKARPEIQGSGRSLGVPQPTHDADASFLTPVQAPSSDFSPCSVNQSLPTGRVMVVCNGKSHKIPVNPTVHTVGDLLASLTHLGVRPSANPRFVKALSQGEVASDQFHLTIEAAGINNSRIQLV
ncbi:hypothetical protein KIPB_005285 [Kipferlia bialata]|uniref:SEP domain-containing protein n=1 Tax=Kipferlia bialata TaxID=797122 RepID=A0A9K3CWT1_9EUKA|nr:hypothetical protein KIPB_000953 [Kipferlia bialata]GIQ83885.1 hypothetical protein KIPB_005285 [Kipferlia bialata]|eukprot:g953.t1